jgi:transglutaminase-like putative cysteine protease
MIRAPLHLSVGCELDVVAAGPTTAVAQVAPHGQQAVMLHRETWDTVDWRHLYFDINGNRCERLSLQSGPTRIAYRADVSVSGAPDEVAWEAREVPPDELPDELLRWIMPSRFCQPDELGNDAWALFGSLEPGWSRVQAICDFVHGHLEYQAGSSNPWTTAADVYHSQQGVCRDFAHLAISFCRALNIPTRYVFGYIPAIASPQAHEEMDFAAWFEVWLADRWYTFDARNNTPRTGRVVVGRGNDAVDVAMLTSLGPLDLVGFKVFADVIDP